MARLRFDNIAIQRKNLERSKQTFFNFYPQLENQIRDKLCPFIIYLGNVNNTEFGESESNKVGDFTTFKKIFTGKDSQIAIWENSTNLTKQNETDDFFIKEFKKGKIINAFRINKNTETLIAPTNELIDAVQETTETTINFLLESRTLSKEDIYKVWVIPTQNTSEFFYISNIVEYVDSNQPETILWSEITFKSLNDKLSNAGQQIQQYISLSAPGEGYAFPKKQIIKIGDTEIDRVVVDKSKTKNQGVKELQIEIFGPAALTSFFAFGRRTFLLDNKVRAPRHLVSWRLNTPIGTDLNQKTSSESTYYFVENGENDLITYYDDWKTKISALYDNDANKNYEGYFKTDYEQVLASNSPTNPAGGDIIKFDIWNQGWLLTTQGSEFDGAAIKYTENIITLPTNASPATLLFVNSFIYIDTEKMPISVLTSTTWTLKSIPLIGGFLNLATFGLPIGWKNTEAKVKAKKINAFIPSSLYDYTNNAAEIAIQGYLPNDVFRADTPDAVGALVGTQAISTTINISLTDKLLKNDEIKDTIDIGQDTDNGGYLIDGGEIPQDPALGTNEAFIIDLINIKFQSKADFKITAYNGETSLWTAYFQSRAKFTGSIREWSNTFKVSNWINNEGSIVEFPALIPEKPPDGSYQNIGINAEYQVKADMLSSTQAPSDEPRVYIYEVDITKYGFTWETLRLVYNQMDLTIPNADFYFENLYNVIEDNQNVSVLLSELDTEGAETNISDIIDNGEGDIITQYYEAKSQRCYSYNYITQQEGSFEWKGICKRDGNIIKFIYTLNTISPQPIKDPNAGPVGVCIKSAIQNDNNLFYYLKTIIIKP